MKKLLLILSLLSAAFSLRAQEVLPAADSVQDDAVISATKKATEAYLSAAAKDDSPLLVKSNWTKKLQIDLGINETGFANWAAGGYNSVSLSTAFDGSLNYSKNLLSWNNRLQLQYGFQHTSDKPWPLIQKTTDRIYLESKFAFKASKDSKWKYTASYDFRSQFAPEYKYNTPPGEDPTIEEWIACRELKSDFASPAYTNLALGIEWVPTSWLDINLAPATAGLTFVSNPLLRKTYSMPLLKEDLDPSVGTNYSASRFEFGAQLKTDIKFNINDKFKFETQVVLFTDYLAEPYLRVNWDSRIEWRFARLFKLGFNTWVINDPWVLLDDGSRRGWQFKQSLALSFSYTFNPTPRMRRAKNDKK